MFTLCYLLGRTGHSGSVLESRCPLTPPWVAVNTSLCILVSNDYGQKPYTWDEAKDRCLKLHPSASLAILTMEHITAELITRMIVNESYWTGSYKQQHEDNSAQSAMCPTVIVTEQALSNQNFDFTWKKDKCKNNHLYICLSDQKVETTQGAATSAATTQHTTPSPVTTTLGAPTTHASTVHRTPTTAKTTRKKTIPTATHKTSSTAPTTTHTTSTPFSTASITHKPSSDTPTTHKTSSNSPTTHKTSSTAPTTHKTSSTAPTTYTTSSTAPTTHNTSSTAPTTHKTSSNLPTTRELTSDRHKIPTTSNILSVTPAVTTEVTGNNFTCSKVSALECKLEAVRWGLPGEMARIGAEELTDFSESLLDEINKVIFRGSPFNSTAAVINYCHVLDIMLAYIVKTAVFNQSKMIDAFLVRVGSFMDALMISPHGSVISQDISLSLAHTDLLVLQADQWSFKGRKLHLKYGEVTVDDIHVNDPTGNRTHMAVAALLLTLPATKVMLVQKQDKTSSLVVSPVLYLAATVDRAKINISHTFSLTVNSLQNVTIAPVCGFQRPNKRETIWDTAGCRLGLVRPSSPFDDRLRGQAFFASGTNRTVSKVDEEELQQVTCRCNHTTNFAILMQIVDFQIGEKDNMALSIVTYIGCSITLITQVMAITVFTCIRSLNSERVCVHRNLCISIMAAQITFISGIQAIHDKVYFRSQMHFRADSMVVCSIVAVILHYFYSTSFMWMLVEGLHLYNQIVKVFGTEKSRIVYYTCFGYGLPLILVVISAAVDWDGYGTSHSCWLSVEKSTIWAFVGPAIAIIFVNFIILIVVLRIVVTAAKINTTSDHVAIRAGLKAALFLLPLVGLTWLFGLLAINKHLLVFQYIFAILNTLQGFFIFMFHCVFNSEVRSALKRMHEKRGLRRGDFVSRPFTSDRLSSSETRSFTNTHGALMETISTVFRTPKVGPLIVSSHQTGYFTATITLKQSKKEGQRPALCT